jgi:hypothetical protein
VRRKATASRDDVARGDRVVDVAVAGALRDEVALHHVRARDAEPVGRALHDALAHEALADIEDGR